MQTKKSKIIYRVSKKLPKHMNECGSFTIHIETRDHSHPDDHISISWQCNFPGERSPYWYACHKNYEHTNNVLFRLFAQMQKINYDSKIEDVLEILEKNNIEHAIRTKLYENHREIYSGNITATEIVAGKFKRRSENPLKILSEQQKELIEQLAADKNIEPFERKAA